jgi:hypothetical protein
MSSQKPLPPGTKADKSGQYKNTSTKNEVTVTRGEPLPPTPKPNQGYVLVDPTKHKGKK